MSDKIKNPNDIYSIEDWRIMGQPGYLFRKNLYYKTFIPYFDDQHPDHAHCEFCNNYFSLEKVSDNHYLHEGYYEPESKSWICETCFQDFKEIFQWTVIKDFTDESKK